MTKTVWQKLLDWTDMWQKAPQQEEVTFGSEQQSQYVN